jgi:hypothetical protein
VNWLGKTSSFSKPVPDQLSVIGVRAAWIDKLHESSAIHPCGRASREKLPDHGLAGRARDVCSPAARTWAADYAPLAECDI